MEKGGGRSGSHWAPIRRKAQRRPLDWWMQPTDLQPVSRRPLAMQAADQIRRRIVLGDVRPGQRLEPARTLARELQISLPVMREALAALAYVGLVEVRHGVGTFVARRPRAARVMRVSGRRAHRHELHAFRTTLAGELAAKAASHRQSEVRMLDLHLAVEERRRSVYVGDPDGFTRADLDLHALVAKSARLPLQATWEGMAGTALWKELAGRAKRLALDDELAQLHERLVAAIEGRRSGDAAETARAIAAIEGEAKD